MSYNSWKSLYNLGAVSAGLYLILGMIVPAILFMSTSYDTSMNGEAILKFIALHRTWWIVTQSLVLIPSVFLIVTFLALYTALKELHQSFALVGIAFAIVSQTLFPAYSLLIWLISTAYP